MPRPRIIVLSANRELGARLRDALGSAGEVSQARVAEEVDVAAALVVVHLEGPLADAMGAVLGRMARNARAIAVLPGGHVAQVVAVMQTDVRIVGVVVVDRLDGARLAAIVGGAVRPSGAQVFELAVRDYEEKSRAIAEISTLAEGMRIRRKYRAAIEQCLDEMLMNALYDAPPDRTTPPRPATVQFASDGARCYLTVRDAYGSLQRATVLRYLHKCLHEEQQIDRKAGGAGLGLYVMASSSSEIYFRVEPGRATEVTCVFDLTSPDLALYSFGCLVEAERARVRWSVSALLAAIVATLLAIGWVVR